GPYGATNAYGYGSAASQSGPSIQQDFYTDAYTGQWDSSSGGQSSASVAIYPDGEQSAADAQSAPSHSGYGANHAGANAQWNPYMTPPPPPPPPPSGVAASQGNVGPRAY
ncbi:hypothetical protein AAVH_35970, partial [Aphelenchoides avenae]